MYKIIDINEKQLPKFKGNIISVINSERKDVVVGTDYLGLQIFGKIWNLTCLVEVKDE